MAPTLRRTIQQAIHCLEEARDAWMGADDIQMALDDVEQARMLCDYIYSTLKGAAQSNVSPDERLTYRTVVDDHR